MKHITKRLCVMALITLMFLAGCASNARQLPVAYIATGRQREFPPAEQISQPYLVQAATGVNTFGFKLAYTLSDGQENLLLSPTSVWLGMASISDAANDLGISETCRQALGVPELPARELDHAAQSMLYTLWGGQSRAEAAASAPTTLVNAVAVDRSITLNRTLAQEMRDYYWGEGIRVNFYEPDAAGQMNGWAAEQTAGRIMNLFDTLPGDELFALSGSLAFSGAWATSFAGDKSGTFYGADGALPTRFMARWDTLSYYEEPGLQCAKLDFANGAAMFLLLPGDGDVMGLLQGMDAARFSSIAAGMAPQYGELTLPAFSMDKLYPSLGGALRTIGLPLFDQEKLPLDKFVLHQSVCLGTVRHRAILSINATGVSEIEPAFEPPTGDTTAQQALAFRMACDRPFLFVITTQMATVQQALLLGVVNKL